MSRLWLLLMRSLEREGATQTGRAGVGLLHPCPLSPGTLTWRNSEKCPILHAGRALPLAPVLAGLSRLPRAASLHANWQKSSGPSCTHSSTGEGMRGSLAGLSSGASRLWRVLQFTQHLLMISLMEVTFLSTQGKKHVCLSASGA